MATAFLFAYKSLNAKKMASQIKVLKQTELLGQQFEVYGTPQEPLFKAQDVATLINHSNITKMLALVDEDEKGLNQLLTPGGNQQVWFLTENGLYEVLMQSRKPIAKQFKRGIKTILREIRNRIGLWAEPAPIAGLRPLYSAGLWLYPLQQLTLAVGYGRGASARWCKRAGDETRLIGGRRYATLRLASFIAETASARRAIEEAKKRFTVDLFPAIEEGGYHE